jgi:hypothetical protein
MELVVPNLGSLQWNLPSGAQHNHKKTILRNKIRLRDVYNKEQAFRDQYKFRISIY